MKKKTLRKTSGYLLLEVLIAVVLLGILGVAIFPTINFMMTRSRRSTVDSQASLILQAGIEATYHIFLTDWNAYPSNASYKLISDLSDPTKPRWLLTPLAPGEVQLVQSKYSRVIEVSEVMRDTQTGEAGRGLVDPNSRIVKSTVSWQEAGINKSVTAQLLLVKLKS